MTPSSVFLATTSEQAHLLLQPSFLGLVYLLQTEASAADLARTVQRPLRQTHHQLTRLLRAGLIEVSQVQQRAGQPIKRYRATAMCYHVPFRLTEAVDVQDLLSRLYQPLIEACAFYIARLAPSLPAPDLVIQIAEGDDGLRYALAPPPEAGPQLGQVVAGFNFQELRPNRAHQRELATKILDLQQWIQERQRLDQVAGTAEPCLVSLLIVPGILQGVPSTVPTATAPSTRSPRSPD